VKPDPASIGFPFSFIPLVRCTHDGGELEAQPGFLAVPGDAGSIRAGRLACVTCAATYFIDDGILNLIDETRLDEGSAAEQRQRNLDCQKAKAPATDSERVTNDMEMTSTLAALPIADEDCVLELGCGEGRYTVALAGRGKLVAVDFSIELLRILRDRLPAGTRHVGLVLGDINTLQVAPKQFRLGLSTLTSNLPSREHRESLYRLARTALAPHGRFVFSTHFHGIRQRMAGEVKSGHYRAGGIYRYHFDLRELVEELHPHFSRIDVHPMQIHLPLFRTLRLPAVRISRLVERVPILNAFGSLLLAKAEAPRG